jgi:hypothetical protein
MGDRFQATAALDRGGDDQRADSGTRGCVVVDVDELDQPRALERAGDLEQPLTRASERRVELNRGDPLAGSQRAGEPRLTQRLAECDRRFGLVELQVEVTRSPRVDRAPDGGDFGRRRPAAASDHVGAEVARLRGELGEVLGCRMRVDDPTAKEARQADVREGGQGQAV